MWFLSARDEGCHGEAERSEAEIGVKGLAEDLAGSRKRCISVHLEPQKSIASNCMRRLAPIGIPGDCSVLAM